MPKIKMLLTTKLSKSSADTTFYTMNNEKYFKKKIDTNTSNTLKQQIQRLIFKEKTDICKALLPVLQVSVPKPSQGLSPSNEFMKHNKTLVEVSNELEVTVNYPKLELSFRNDRDTLENITVSANEEEHTLSFQHTAEEYGVYADPSDVVYAALYNPTLQRAKLCKLNTRDDIDAVIVEIPQRWQISDLHIYVFVTSEDGKKSSLCDYLTIQPGI